MRASRVIAVLVSTGAWGAAGAAGAAEAAQGVPAYEAVYQVYYRGMAVGETEFSVTAVAGTNNVYEFRSGSRFKGLFGLLAPNPTEEFSKFAHENGRIRPLAYSLRDGTRRGRNDFRVEFDWEQGRATIAAADVNTEVQLVPGLLDSGSLRVALMLRPDPLAAEQISLIDRDGVEIHELRPNGEETLETSQGRFETRRLIQQRLNSSRRTVIWVAADLRNLPVRIERQVDDETRVTLHLKSVRWHN